MNPLFLTIGLLRWEDDKGSVHDAPLILVPVNLRVPLRSRTAQLTIDTTSQVAPNFALLEWLSREHDLSIPELKEPTADKAGIDVHATLAAVRLAVRQAGLPFTVLPEGRLALLDLAAFRMWQDLNVYGERFLSNPLVSHLVHTPLERFVDPAATEADIGIWKSCDCRSRRIQHKCRPSPGQPRGARLCCRDLLAPASPRRSRTWWPNAC